VSSALLENVYTVGSVPGAASPVDKELWDTSHVFDTLKCVRQRYPEHGIFGFEEIESSGNSECIQVPVFQFLVVPKAVGPPPPFLRLKSVAGDEPIITFQDLKLEWRPSTEKNISYLMYCGRERRYSEVSKEGLYKRAKIMDCRASKAFKMDDHGRFQVDSAHFTYKIPGRANIEGTYVKCGDLKSYIAGFCEEHHLDEADHRDSIKKAIKEAFTSKRALLQTEMDLVHDGRNVEMLEDIVCGKIYPKNLEQGIAMAIEKQKADRQAAREKDLKQKGPSDKLDSPHDQRPQPHSYQHTYTPIAALDMPLRVKKTDHLYGDAEDDLIF